MDKYHRCYKYLVVKKERGQDENNEEYIERKKQSLFANEKITKDSLVIRVEYKIDNYQSNYYIHFSDLQDFLKSKLKFINKEQCLHEVILNNNQKPYFDFDAEEIEYFNDDEIIDPKLKGTKILKKIPKNFALTFEEGIEAINILKDIIKYIEPKIKDENILVLNSHGFSKNKGYRKISYSVIIDGFYYRSSRDTQAFFEEVCKYYPEKYIKALDKGVYSKNHCFRVYQCHKLGEPNRRKVIDQLSTWVRPFKPKNDNHEWNMELEASLITNTNSCQPLVSFAKNEENSIFNGKEVSLHEDEINAAVNLYAKLINCTSYEDDNFPFIISKCDGPSIVLKRINSSYCHCCDKEHDSIDVFLTIRSYERTVVLNCFRDKTSKFIVGNLNTNIKKNDEEEILHLNIEPIKLSRNYEKNEDEDEINNYIKYKGDIIKEEKEEEKKENKINKENNIIDEETKQYKLIMEEKIKKMKDNKVNVFEKTKFNKTKLNIKEDVKNQISSGNIRPSVKKIMFRKK